MSKISAYIIAFNEEDKIRAAVESVLWVDEIIVADSYSTDKTAEIAESLGAKVVQIPFQGFGDLRNNAISACQYEWIFSLDSDERCTPEVRDEISGIIHSENPLDIYFVPRKNFFMGRWIKYSGFYPNYRQPQLFINGKMTYDMDEVHEGYISHSDKSIGYLKSAIWQIPFKGLEEILHKANRYSSLGAEKLSRKNKKGGMVKALFRAFWAFIQHYIFKKGALDGWAGFMIAFGNFEGTFYKYAKLYELQAGWKPPCSGPIQKP